MHNPREFIARDQVPLVLLYQRKETQSAYSDTTVMPRICITVEVENKGNAELRLLQFRQNSTYLLPLDYSVTASGEFI